jgi:Brix domain
MQGATSVLFFEARKRSDLYMWLAKVPSGPSARFLCSNVHTMAELKLSGNHLKGSRPVLSFDASFDEQPQLQVRCTTASHAVRVAHLCCMHIQRHLNGVSAGKTQS